ncbi:MAG TPA: HAD family phosphatase [Verrucomicrobiae bacterium]|jgi:HAD superfamily hydrolase (TIGR01509 family)
MLPEIVVFDLGKVLVDFNFGLAARRIAAASKVTAEAVQTLIDHSPLLFRYETGQINKEEFYRAICEETGYNAPFNEFSTAFSDIFAPIPEMIHLHGRLREAGVPVFIFSNTNDLALAHIRRNYPFIHYFDGYVFSFEQGSMKPQAPIYEAVEKLTGRRGKQILYLDDRLDNAEAGRARGWEVIQHRAPDESISLVERFGLLN